MSSDPNQPVLGAVGDWIADLSFEVIPERVVDHAKSCLLDGIGCGFYGAAQPWGVIAADMAEALAGKPTSSLFARSAKVSSADAALANGTAIHGFEIDDVHVASSLHPGAVTIPAVLALAEARGIAGRDALVAMIAGYEIGIRLGICAGTTHSTSGYHVTGTVGAVAATVAAARVLRLPAGAAAHAIALGATQASGLYAARKGAMAKRFHAGRAAQSGVIAALLAERGMTGALDVLEADFGGFISTMRGQQDPSGILAGLGETWETVRVGFKIYAACASAHTTIDAVRSMAMQGLTPGNLDQLTIGMSRKAFLNVGWRYEPKEVVSAQMNASFAAAVQLLDGAAFTDQYTPERLADPRILAITDRVSIVHEPRLDAGGAAKRHAITASARLLDGRVLTVDIEQRTGSAERPISSSQLREKFDMLTRAVGQEEAGRTIAARIAALETLPTLAGFLDA